MHFSTANSHRDDFDITISHRDYFHRDAKIFIEGLGFSSLSGDN